MTTITEFQACKISLRRLEKLLTIMHDYTAGQFLWNMIKSEHSFTRIDLALQEIQQENVQIELDRQSREFWAA